MPVTESEARKWSPRVSRKVRRSASASVLRSTSQKSRRVCRCCNASARASISWPGCGGTDPVTTRGGERPTANAPFDRQSVAFPCGQSYNSDMGDLISPVKFTYEHYCLWPEGDRRELIEGNFFVTPAPTEKHQRLCGNLYFYFRLFLEQHPVGRVYIAPFDVILDEFSTVQPDLCFIENERLGKLKTEGLRGTPDLAIEVLSPGTRGRDEKLKKELYFKHGLRELWLVDPEDDSVSVYERRSDGLNLWRRFPKGTVVKSCLLEHLTMAVDDVVA